MTGKTVVPEEAVEAAARVLASHAYPISLEKPYEAAARAALEAAAPFIAAKALEEGAIELLSDESAPPKSVKEMYVAWLSARAAAVRGEG